VRSVRGACSHGRLTWRTCSQNGLGLPRAMCSQAGNVQTQSRLDTLREKLQSDKQPFADFVKREEGIVDQGEEEVSLFQQQMENHRVEGKEYFIETLGCQMNFADSEIVASVLEGAGYNRSMDMSAADVVLVNTCAIRENAEEKALQRLRGLRKQRKKTGQQVGVLGCMAERMKATLLEGNLVNVVAGPDSYRDLPSLLSVARGEEQAMNVQLSVDETYADIAPVRMGDSWHAYISITRGCNNMCTYCIVPFTRGRERSRTANSIVEEVKRVSSEGRIKEITLLGQNVNSYYDKTEKDPVDGDTYKLAEGFSDTYKTRQGSGVRFAKLLDRVASVDDTIRIRFTSPHPKDFTDDVLTVMAKHKNICNSIHLPAQSGSNSVLKAMGRGYTREAYLDLVRRARNIIGPELELSSDFISGFCGETEEDHQQTLSLMDEVAYEQCFMFAYSERKKTRAYHRLDDDVPKDVKLRRLAEVVAKFREVSQEKAKTQVGKEYEILVEGPSRRDENIMQGKTHGLRRCVIVDSTPETCPSGSYVKVKVIEANQTTLKGKLI